MNTTVPHHSPPLPCSNNECPSCRAHCASRRSLRADPRFDALVAAVFPNRDRIEKEEADGLCEGVAEGSQRAELRRALTHLWLLCCVPQPGQDREGGEVERGEKWGRGVKGGDCLRADPRFDTLVAAVLCFPTGRMVVFQPAADRIEKEVSEGGAIESRMVGLCCVEQGECSFAG
ncbi:unnamed protein product [Closterium sp. Naga37s-1]|nr:unnamed protein product [Closterium sp. Naga37s-1]